MSEGSRRLAAVMFTDMVGYTALTQSDESLAMEVLERHNRLLRPFFPKFHGREVKTMGDSFLVEFESALDAARCAIEIQSFLHDYNVSSKDEWKIKLRIGIHLGDVIHHGGDVFGDAVNLASRIEPIAEPEGICITEQVYAQLHKKLARPLISLGDKSLKNVGEQIVVYKVEMPWEEGSTSWGPSNRNRIAVLPFINISPDARDEYFADGLTEELITRVSFVKGLEVIARTSVMNYKKKEKNATQIAKELKVGSLLEGSVRKAGNRVRITAQLIDARTESHLWAENYDRDLEDVFSIQSEIAQEVAGALKIRLVESDQEKIGRAWTRDTTAHDLYLKGRFHLQSATEEEYMTALGYFERSIDRDPDFALAYAGMASAYNFLGFFEIMPSREAFAKSEKMARKALELDESLPEAHLAMAGNLRNSWEFEAAMRQTRRALELNSSLAAAHYSLAMDYAFAWQFDKGLAEIQKAIELDPLSPRALQSAGTWYLYTGQPAKAAEFYKRVLEIDPHDSFATGNLGLCFVKQGVYDEGIDQIKKGIGMSKSFDPSRHSDLTYALAKAGRQDEARAIISKLLEYHETHQTGAGAIAFAYGSVGDKDKAFEWLEKGYREHSGYLTSASLDFGLEDLRSDPKFLAFLKRIRHGSMHDLG